MYMYMRTCTVIRMYPRFKESMIHAYILYTYVHTLYLSREEADVVRISLEQGIELIKEHLNTLLPVENDKNIYMYNLIQKSLQQRSHSSIHINLLTCQFRSI